MRPDTGDIARPPLVGPARATVLLQEVWHDVECLAAVGCCFEFMGSDHANRVLLHQTAYPVLADADARFVQLRGHARPAVAGTA